MSKKPVIVFEGIEGSGKTFYINLISNYLKKKRISYKEKYYNFTKSYISFKDFGY